MQLAKHGIPRVVSSQLRERLNALQDGKLRLNPLARLLRERFMAFSGAQASNRLKASGR
jgi:hypothetical protein